MVNGVGVVLGGTVKKGQIMVNSTYLMGPDKNGNFKPVTVKSIEENRVGVDSAQKGTSICVAIKNTNKKDLVTKHSGMRKGMSLIELSKAH
jgi:elongation factor 1-alpha